MDPNTWTPDPDTSVLPLDEALPQMCVPCQDAIRQHGTAVCGCVRFPFATVVSEIT